MRVGGSVLVDFKCEEAVALTVSGKASGVATLKTYYEDDTLVLETEATDAKSRRDRGPLRVVLRLPTAPDVEVQGAATVAMHDIEQAKICFEINGSGCVSAVGKVSSLEVTVGGAGELKARGLIAEKATVAVSGSGDAEVAVQQVVIGRVEEAGSLVVHGQPPTRSILIQEAGCIKFR